MSRGYFGIGIVGGKTRANVGTLWRSAYQLGASMVFTAGARYSKMRSDTCKTWKHVPMFEYEDLNDLLAHCPNDCQLVGIEMGGKSLRSFIHPERCLYILGAEDHGLTPAAMSHCQHIISLPAVRTESFNVAVAGSLVMYDRLNKIIDKKEG